MLLLLNPTLGQYICVLGPFHKSKYFYKLETTKTVDSWRKTQTPSCDTNAGKLLAEKLLAEKP